MKKSILNFAFIIFSVLFILPLKIQAQTNSYQVIDSIEIGGGNRWDYLTADPAGERLYVTHATSVAVIDMQTDKIVGEISDLDHIHGVAIVREFGKGYISNGGNSTVTVFNLMTLKKIKEIPVTGKGPDAIVYDPFTKRVFTFNGHGKNSTAIDAKTDKVVGTVALDGGPEFAASDGHGKMYVNLEDESEIEEFNPSTLKVINKWPIAPGKSPSGLAMDTEHGILFSGCRNNMMAVVDAKTGKVITTVPIGRGVDACRYDAAAHLAFASCWDGTLTVIKQESPTKYKLEATVKTDKGARTMALDTVTHRIYTSTMIHDKDGKETFGVLVLAFKK